MAIRSPKHNSDGFTMIEMIAVLVIVSVVAGFTLPSFISLNKPLKDGTSLFKSQLTLIRSKAIASGQAYRLTPMYSDRTNPGYLIKDQNNINIPDKFVVQYAATCRSTTGWQRASQFDLELPNSIGITDNASTSGLSSDSGAIPTVSNDLDWRICFDNRGTIGETATVIIKDFKSNNRAKTALFMTTQIGGIDVFTYDANNNRITDAQAY